MSDTIKTSCLRGVNLGNWLLLERWMSPAMYPSKQATDEYTLCAHLGEDAPSVLRSHRETWITEDDFAWLAARGVTAVRIPFGYWILEADGPYVSSPDLLDHAVDCCERHGLAAVLDLHGLPGSQGPEHHTGQGGYFRWPADASHVAHSLDVIEQVAQRYAGRDCIAGLSVVNEPHESIARETLVEFYEKACERVRRHMPADDVAVVIAAYPENLMSAYHGCMPAHPNIWTDVHLYQNFVPWPAGEPFKYLQAAIDRHERLRRWISDGPVIVGEWSLSWPHEFTPALRAMSSAVYNDFMRAYASIQLASFDQTTGWFFWSYRTEDRPHWSFRDAVQRGWLPDHFGYEPVESVEEALCSAVSSLA